MDVAANNMTTGPPMPNTDKSADTHTAFEEAVALYEAAQAEFEQFKLEFRSRLRENPDFEALEHAKWKLHRSRARLMKLFRAKDRRSGPT